MNKRKLMSSLFAGAMTLGMTLSVSPVFAKTAPAKPVAAYLVKQLDVADGITYSKEFAFNFDLISKNSETVSGITGDKTISIEVSNANPIVAKNIFDADALQYTSAGIYTYEVTESQDGEKQSTDTYGLTCSDAKYQLQVKVANDDNGGVFVDNVIVEKINDDNGNDYNVGDGKVNPNPTPDDNDGTDSQFKFVNTYTKQAGTTDPDDDTKNLALAISKEVTGDYGDKTFGFTFNVTIKLPETADTAKTYTGKVGETSSYTFKHNVPTVVTLAHGQKLKFEDLPAGTTYSVTETGKAGYTATVVPTTNDVQGSETTGLKGQNVTVTSLVGGEGLNSTAFTNAYDDNTITPTGIIINNLPFVLMVGIAGSGLALYVVSKRRTHQ